MSEAEQAAQAEANATEREMAMEGEWELDAVRDVLTNLINNAEALPPKAKKLPDALRDGNYQLELWPDCDG